MDIPVGKPLGFGDDFMLEKQLDELHVASVQNP